MDKKEGQPLYDVALDDYEEGFTMKILDSFFDSLKEALGPLVKKISEKPDAIPRDFLQNFIPQTPRRSFAIFLPNISALTLTAGLWEKASILSQHSSITMMYVLQTII